MKEFVQKEWEPIVLPTLKQATQQHDKYILKAHVIPAFGEHRLSDISCEAIQNFLQAKHREEYSSESVHHFRCALTKLLGATGGWNYITDNPVRKTRLPIRDGNLEPPIVTPQHVARPAMPLSPPIHHTSVGAYWIEDRRPSRALLEEREPGRRGALRNANGIRRPLR